MKDMKRREFLLRSGGVLAMGSVGLGGVVPAEGAVGGEMVRFRPEIEPVVRWIERTKQDKILDVAAEELKKGLSYRGLLAGLFLAGIRNIKPRPVGFKFHAVMVIHSAHQLSLDGPQGDRLVPIFWALDNFKRSQQRDVREGDWWLGPVKEAKVPNGRDSVKRLQAAMDSWDAEGADAAVAGLCRSAGANELMERLWEYGARDFRHIGHHIIYTAQAFRTLQTIGFEHAEPVMRSLVYGLLGGKRGDSTAAPYEINRGQVKQVRAGWREGRQDDQATLAFLDMLRSANSEEASSEAVKLLNEGVSAESIWDALHLASGEMLMRRGDILSLHAATSLNSLHYGYRASGVEETRLLMLLQGASWITLYRRGLDMTSESGRLDKLEPASEKEAMSLDDIFTEMGSNRKQAARGVLRYVRDLDSAKAYISKGRRLIFNKGRDSHDYKYSAAMFEDVHHVHPVWRGQLMAASAFYLKAATAKDTPLWQRTQDALARLS